LSKAETYLSGAIFGALPAFPTYLSMLEIIAIVNTITDLAGSKGA
jgi:hypothetical protein